MHSNDLEIKRLIATSRLSSLIDMLAIERIALLDTLDRSSVPVVSVICPESSDVITTYAGKGKCIEQALVSGIMECAERTLSSWQISEVLIRSEEEIRLAGLNFLPISSFSYSPVKEWSPCSMIPWVKTKMLEGGSECYVPGDLIFWGGSRPDLEPLYSINTTNGLAAHFDETLAIQAALKEVIERHIVSIRELEAGDHGLSFLANACEALGINAEKILKNYTFTQPTVYDVGTSITPFSKQVDLSLKAASVNMHLKYLGSMCGLHVIGCATREICYDGRYLDCAGYGISNNFYDAVDKAVLEMCQSRITDKQGSREDCGIDEKGRQPRRTSTHWMFKNADCLDEIPATDSNWYSRCIGEFDKIVVYRFRTVDEIAVVRVLIPGSESWHSTAGKSRLMLQCTNYSGLL